MSRGPAIYPDRYEYAERGHGFRSESHLPAARIRHYPDRFSLDDIGPRGSEHALATLPPLNLDYHNAVSDPSRNYRPKILVTDDTDFASQSHGTKKAARKFAAARHGVTYEEMKKIDSGYSLTQAYVAMYDGHTKPDSSGKAGVPLPSGQKQIQSGFDESHTDDRPSESRFVEVSNDYSDDSRLRDDKPDFQFRPRRQSPNQESPTPNTRDSEVDPGVRLISEHTYWTTPAPSSYENPGPPLRIKSRKAYRIPDEDDRYQGHSGHDSRQRSPDMLSHDHRPISRRHTEVEESFRSHRHHSRREDDSLPRRRVTDDSHLTRRRQSSRDY